MDVQTEKINVVNSYRHSSERIDYNYKKDKRINEIRKELRLYILENAHLFKHKSLRYLLYDFSIKADEDSNTFWLQWYYLIKYYTDPQEREIVEDMFETLNHM